uniref:MIP12479p n=1 Tax=Drosophila melanogaster TaxID=7227 RepID=C9QP66_DROME|nr:MIP12479p [Drosophila melanogaster]
MSAIRITILTGIFCTTDTADFRIAASPDSHDWTLKLEFIFRLYVFRSPGFVACLIAVFRRIVATPLRWLN